MSFLQSEEHEMNMDEAKLSEQLKQEADHLR